jgi:hypothetical protein
MAFKNISKNYYRVVTILLFLIFSVSIFKNIAYPLFWADESMTVMGVERVIQFGYPKVHDGRNVFYDLKHPDTSLGISKKYDAYIAGSGWAQYYYGVIGYKLATLTEDFYTKTAIIRSSFAIIGLIGICLFAFIIGKFFKNPITKNIFYSLFLLCCIHSVSLALHIREARYYSPTLFLMYVVLGSYILYRFYYKYNAYLYTVVTATSLCLVFLSFSPAFFIAGLSIVLSEIIISISNLKKSSIKQEIISMAPIASALFIAFIIVLPLISFFKTFEITKIMAAHSADTSPKYLDNLKSVIKYLSEREFLWLALALKALVIFNINKATSVGDRWFEWTDGQSIKDQKLFKVSMFLFLLIMVNVFSISNMYGFLYTRYITYLQPLLSVMLILDLFLLLSVKFNININNTFFSKLVTNLSFGLMTILFLSVIYKNVAKYKGHVYELTHQYEGPLDKVIPYIKERFEHPEKLIIATNYEETSFMYYLRSKVIIGYVGNNLAEDTKIMPDIISWRKEWPDHNGLLKNMIINNDFNRKGFNVKSSLTNTIPEFNYGSILEHQFKTQIPTSREDETDIWVKDHTR